MKIMALVTAKSKSDRIPHKNKVVLHGKPLYKWTTDFLNDNRDFFSSLVFSSDYPHSFNTGDGWLKLVRPPELLKDSSPHIQSVIQCLGKAEQINQTEYDAIFLFQPTNPFRNAKMLYHAMSMLEHHKDPDYPYRSYCMYRDSNLSKSYIHGARFQGDIVKNPMVRSGSLYVYNRSFLLGDDRSNAKQMCMIIPKVWGYNINDGLDIRIVETLMKESGILCGGSL
jgi:CMP-N-acetylneuraminic acid synthetase